MSVHAHIYNDASGCVSMGAAVYYLSGIINLLTVTGIYHSDKKLTAAKFNSPVPGKTLFKHTRPTCS